MNDDLDQMLQGENQDSPVDSQSTDTSSGSYSGTGDNAQGTEGSDEEAEWNKLSGNATDRFRTAFRERQKLRTENEKLRELITQGGTQQAPNTGTLQLTPQVKQAVEQLDSVGVATKEYVQKQVQEILAQKTYYDELGKLESKLDGSDGKPRFAREEYFDYVDRHPQYKNYLPEDVYEKMFSEELSNWKTTKGGDEQPQRRSPVLRPTRTVSRETELNVDEIEAKLKSLPEPQRSEWYQANIKKINAAVARAGQS